MHRPIPYNKAHEQLSLKEKVGQLFMPAAFINDSEEEIQKLEKLISESYVGSLCFFHSRASAATNFEGKKEVVFNKHSFDLLKAMIIRYQKAAKHPLLIAIDAEWGLAMRIENTPQYPYAIALGAIQGQNELLFEVGKNIAHDCKVAGIHWNLGPVVDINNNPENPVIGYRSFGENKLKVAEKAIAFVKGTESQGVLTSIKHFPGHGDTATDSHLELPLINKSKETLFSNELYPFQKLIDEGVDSVMIGHLSVPSLTNGSHISSSISKRIIKGILRAEMGFQGVVISDALNMHAVAKNYPVKGELEWLAFEAGNDVLCFAENVREGVSAILKNADAAQIEASFERVWRLKEKAILSREGNNEQLSDVALLNSKLAEASLTLAKGTEKKIAAFREEGYQSVSLQKDSETHTVYQIEEKIKALEAQISSENILLLLTPPKVKPANNFEISKQELDFINKLMETKKVVLYVFGNPYVLNLIQTKRAIAVVCVYQNLKAFKHNAGLHFMGDVKANGKLPVTIKDVN